jgi:hypothetical protein
LAINRTENLSAILSDAAVWPMLLLVSLLDILSNRSRKGGNMCYSKDVIVDFPVEGVRVKIPPQNSKKKMYPKSVPSVPIDKLRSDQDHDEFTPARFVINVEIVDANNPMTIMTDFDPPIEIWVKCTEEDLTRLENAKAKYRQAGDAVDGKGEPVSQLGFWNGSRWVLFTKKHNYKIMPDGSEYVKLSKWGDPPMAHGP